MMRLSNSSDNIRSFSGSSVRHEAEVVERTGMPGYKPSRPFEPSHGSPSAKGMGRIYQFLSSRSGRPKTACHATTRIDSVETNGSFLQVGGSTNTRSVKSSLEIPLSASNTPVGTPCRLERLWKEGWGLWDQSTEPLPVNPVAADCTNSNPASPPRSVLRIDIPSPSQMDALGSNYGHPFAHMSNVDSSSDVSEQSDTHSAFSGGEQTPSSQVPSAGSRRRAQQQHFFANTPRSNPVSPRALHRITAPSPLPPAPHADEAAADEPIAPSLIQQTTPPPVRNSNSNTHSEAGIWCNLIRQAQEMARSLTADIDCNPFCCINKN